MTDPIDRQAAIDAIENITSSMSVCVNSDECHGMKRMQRQAVIELAKLPSVQQEIVRCKDCKNRYIDCPMHHVEWIEYDDDGYIDVDDIAYDYTEDDGFCYKGVRNGFD